MYAIRHFFFSQTSSLMISSSTSVCCPHFKITEPISLILGTSGEKGKNCVPLLTQMILEMD